MGGRRWTTDPQHLFLEGHLRRWEEGGELHGLTPFYARVTREFIELWKSPIPTDIADKSITDEAKVVLADERRGTVSSNLFFFSTPYSLSPCQQITNWFRNNRRKLEISVPPLPKPVLDLTGKVARKPCPLQVHQASPSNTISPTTLRYGKWWTICGILVRRRRLSSC